MVAGAVVAVTVALLVMRSEAVALHGSPTNVGATLYPNYNQAYGVAVANGTSKGGTVSVAWRWKGANGWHCHTILACRRAMHG